jgi:uncharacterized protein (UPF0332 family)
MSDPAGPDRPEVDENPIEVEVGQTLFEKMTKDWVEPEVIRRRAAGTWSDEDLVYRFQVQFLDDEVAVRLNDEVKGILEVRAIGPIEKGQEITEEDFSEIAGYRPLDQDAHHPHVTGFAHHDEWFLAFQLGQRDPSRFEVLKVGREFLSAAHDAYQDVRLRVFFDTANSAVELLAKAELLSCGPTIELAQNVNSHRALSVAYNLWTGRLGNSDRRFADALNRLAKLRRQARYLTTELAGDKEEAAELLAVLDDMEQHVTHLAEAPMSELPDGFTVMATRELKAGELVSAEEMTIFPT